MPVVYEDFLAIIYRRHITNDYLFVGLWWALAATMFVKMPGFISFSWRELIGTLKLLKRGNEYSTKNLYQLDLINRSLMNIL